MKDSVILMNQPPITRWMLKGSITDNQLSDDDLIVCYKTTHDSHYVGLLYKRYSDLIIGISLKYLKDRQDAEDMSSRVFEKLTEVLKDKEVGVFRNWLYVLVKNNCVSYLRSKKTEIKRRSLYEEYIRNLKVTHDILGNHLDQLNQRDREESMVRQWLETLPEKQRRCIRYFYFEDRTYKEIAEMMRVNVGKVRSYIQNGRRNLRLMIERAGQ